MTSWTEAHAYAAEQDDPTPPACPECETLQRLLDLERERRSEVVFDNETDTPLTRDSDGLPPIVGRLVRGCQMALAVMQAARAAREHHQPAPPMDEQISYIASVLRTVYRV